MIDVIIPTYGRAHKLAAVAIDLAQGTRAHHRPVFVVEADDVDSIAAVREIGLEPLINERARNYAGACNTALRHTSGEFLFCGADDLHFHPGWDIAARAMFAADPWVGVVGTNDLLNPYVAQGSHSTHSLVRRSYLMEIGGVVDEGPGSWLHEGYGHNYTDTEFIGTAKARARFRPCLASVVEHMHQLVGKTPYDDTHAKADACYGTDSLLYDERSPLWHSLSR